MANSLPWSVKGVDPRTRDAAKAAARRAGMTLGEWLDHKIRDESEEAAPMPEPAAAPAAPPEQLDIAALSERLSRLSQAQTDTAPRQTRAAQPSRSEIEAVVRQAATAEKLTRETSARTAGALDSIARWIEKTEDRLVSGERSAAERQERATHVIAEAIKTMGERIVEIERRAGEAQPAGQNRSPRLAFSRDGLAAAVTDIRTRQRLLDHAEEEAPRPTQDRISALREDLRELSARLSPETRRAPEPPPRPAPSPFPNELAQAIEAKISALGERLDKIAGRDHFEPVLKPLARLEAEVSRLSQDRAKDGYQHVQLEIAHLGSKIDALATESGSVDLTPLAHDIADLRSLFAENSNDRRLEELSQQIASLGFEVGRLRESQPDMRELRSLSSAIDDVRSAVLTNRSRETSQGPLSTLAVQIDKLSEKFDTLATRRPDDQLDHRIDALQQRIEHLAEQGPAAVTRQIEALAGRIENLAASSELARMAESREAPADLRPIEDMLRHLAEKIDEAGTPGANSDSFEALEQQISGLAARLDEAAATRNAETGIERTLQDLVVHLRSMREETAAERAALAQATSAATTPGKGIAELSSLVTGLRDTHVSTERQTQDALGALHHTLEAIMGRLSNLEGELLTERKTVASRPAAPRVQDPLARQEPGMRPAASPGREAGAATPAADHAPSLGDLPLRAEPTLALPSTAFDLPLEPGSGRPRPEAPAGSGQDAQSVRQSLIAAARRSARAASEAASTTPAAASEPATKSPSRLREIMEKRKRPLLLGLAALILALGTAQVVTTTLRGKDAKTVSNESQRLSAPPAGQPDAPAAQPQAAPAEQAPPKDQSSAATPPAPAPADGRVAATADTAPSPAPAGSPGPAVAAVAPEPAGPAPAASEPVQAATAIGDLPTGLGSAGLRKAALDGDARAVYELASRAADGPAGTRDLKVALRLFERAAVAGLAPAQFRLGNMFEKGLGAPRDLALARIWYQRAAERGNAKAMHNLAVLSAEGAAGKPDYATANAWFAKAAELGVRDSQYNLAVLLGRGLGAPTDLGQSYVWFAVAAAQGDEDAAKKRDEVAQRLKPDELAAAKARAAGWKPRLLDATANEVTAPAKGWDAGPTASAAKPGKPNRS